MNLTLTSDRVQRYLNDFADLVSDKHFKKIPYAKWRMLKQGCEKDENYCWHFIEHKTTVELCSIDYSVEFEKEDDSFGAFVMNNILNNVTEVKIPATAVASDTSAISSSISFYANDRSTTAMPSNMYWSNNGTATINIPMKCDNCGNFKEKEKENKKMKGFNFDFGPCSGDTIRMSMYGLAVKNANGVWVSYNPADGAIVDVDVFNFDGGKYMFKMPVAVKDIAVGDIVIHNRVPMFITSVDGKLEAVDVRAGEQKTIIPTTNMFGFNFVTKIVSMFSAFNSAPTPDAPFGNMLPFLMMGENGGEDVDPMLMFMMMQGNGGTDMLSNPMMMYFMMKDKGNDSMLPMLMMMNMNK